MATEHFELGGTSIASVDLRGARARDLASRVEARRIPYATLVGCWVIEDHEMVVLDLEIEVPQKPQFDIRSTERIAIRFDVSDLRMPGITALRRDFPSVPHLNLTSLEEPKSLCLFEMPYVEIRLRLTTPWLVEQVRDWLRRTSRNELHAGDQPLEPLLFGAEGALIVPHTIVTRDAAGDVVFPLRIIRAETVDQMALWVVEGALSGSPSRNRPLACAVIHALPRTHGVMAHRPKTLFELHSFLGGCGVDLLSVLRTFMREQCGEKQFHEAPLMLIVIAPKTRAELGPVESHDIWAFLSIISFAHVGADIGVFHVDEGVARLRIGTDLTARGENVALHLLNVLTTMSREEVGRVSGRHGSDERQFVAVGAGSLGSQVILNAARTAFGRWKVIDNDVLLPHNVARHGLLGQFISCLKADAVSWAANDLFAAASPVHTSLVVDVLRPGTHAQPLSEAFDAAQMIVDMSASIPVARHLARDVPSTARRISLFLNPSGTDLVLLGESRNRTIRLDVIEMQYYRALLQNEDLAAHLAPPPDRLRYSRSCRDVSAQISQEMVALHAAIGARAIRSVTDEENAVIRIWRANPKSGEVSLREFPVTASVQYEIGGWMVITDDGFRQKLAALRSAKLPCETGGVLLGSFDIETRTVYVVDTIPSPSDSEERTTSYIRGSAGLSAAVEVAETVTGGEVQYIGEWHSHPTNHSCHPSALDAQLFGYLSDQMDLSGLPAVMMIIGHENALAVFVGQMTAGDLRDENRLAVVSGLISPSMPES